LINFMKIKVFDSKTLKNVIEINLALVTRIQNECVIGRSPESGLVLDSPDISRLHGKFLLENGNYYFCDLGSRNGSLINGKIAESGHKHLLNTGDTIRLGEFVLILEAVKPQPENLVNTVYRSLDATVVSSWQEGGNLNQLPAVSQVPEAATTYQEMTHIQPQEEALVAEDVVETPVEIAQVAFSDSQPIELIEVAELDKNINQVIESEQTESISEPVVSNAESSTITPVIELEETSLDEEVVSQNLEQSTRQDVPEEITSTTAISPEPNVSEVTNEIVDEIAVTDLTLPSDELGSNTVDNTTASEESIATATPAIAQLDKVVEVTTIQTTAEISESETPDLLASEKVSDISEPDVSQVEEISEPLVSNNQVLETTNDVSSELAEVEPGIEISSDISKIEEDSNSIDNLKTDAETTVSSDVETEPEAVLDIDSSELQEEQTDSPKPEIPEIISTKYIALIAHDSQRWELAEFVTKHQEFFSKCLTIATPSVSEILSSQSGINTTEQTAAATSGGYQTITAKARSGDILAIIFLKDFLQIQAQSVVANEEGMLKVCNMNQVMVATNLSTAEAIIAYIQSGGM
jgi:methylglyoxal synthase/pSer/pThr/pTyr-binding forkhead associated (FHA) protein